MPLVPLSKTLSPWKLQGSFCFPNQTLIYTCLWTSLIQEKLFPIINRRTPLPSGLGASPSFLRAPHLNAQLPTRGLFFTVMLHSCFWPILGILNNCLKSFFYTSECDFVWNGNQPSLSMQINGEI